MELDLTRVQLTGSEDHYYRHVYFDREYIGCLVLIVSNSPTKADAYACIPPNFKGTWDERFHVKFRWKRDRCPQPSARKGGVLHPEVAREEAIKHLYNVWRLEKLYARRSS